MEAEVGKERNVLSALLALGQFRENQETPPAAALSEPNALQSHGQVVKVAFCHTALVHDLASTQMLVAEVQERKDDTNREDPSRDVERQQRRRGDLRCPSAEDEKVDGSKCVDRVDSNGKDEGKPQVDVC